MAKLIDKKDCTFENGYVVYNGETVGVDLAVLHQARRLDVMVQQYDWLKGQPKHVPEPMLKGFKAKHVWDKVRPYVAAPETPIMDAKVAEGMLFMQEVRAQNTVVEINEMIDRFGMLIDWLSADKFVENPLAGPQMFDTPTLGNPLELKAEDVVAILKQIAEAPVDLAPCDTGYPCDTDGDR